MNEGERVMLGNKKIDQVNSSSHLGSIISKDGVYNEDAKIRIAKATGVFPQKFFGRIGR